MDSYNEFAEYYDRLMEDVDYRLWFNYMKDIFSKYNYDPNSILEMACGTGSLTRYLGEEGYSVTCFDLSEEMLSIAYNKLRRYPNVKVLNQDMTNFSLNKKYDAILCLCDSMNYIIKDEDLFQVFRNAYKHLNNNGLFIFDINSYYKLKNVIGNNTFVEDKDDIYYVWENYYDDELSVCEFYLTFFIKEDGFYRRFDEKHIQRAYSVEYIKKALRDVGFTDVAEFEGFTFDLPCIDSERVNFVARK